MKKLVFLAAIAVALSSCNTDTTADANHSDSTHDGNMTQEQKEERNKETAMNALKGIEANNADSVFANVDKDAMDYGDGSMPPIKGADSAKVGLKSWMDAMGGTYKGSDLMAVADGDYVMVYGTWKGTWKNDFMGMKATNKSFEIRDVDIFRFNDAGKITEHRFVMPNSIVAQQIGMSMPTENKN